MAGAVIRQVFNVNPLSLTADEFGRLYSEAMFCKQLDQDIMKRTVLEALQHAFAKQEEN